MPREDLAAVGAVVIAPASDHDLGAAVAVDVADRRARPHRVVHLALPDLLAVRAADRAPGGVLDGPELAARPVDGAAGRLVAADQDVQAAVAVHVVERGRRPHAVLDVVSHDLVAVAVDRVHVQVERAEDDVGVTVAVDVADRGRREHGVRVAVGAGAVGPDVAVVEGAEAAVHAAVGVEDHDAALLVRRPRAADTDDDLAVTVVEQVADGGRAVDRRARLLRPTGDVAAVPAVDHVEQPALVPDDDLGLSVAVDVGDRR